MQTFVDIADLRRHLAAERAEARRIGFVPTMGYLHEGHLSLVRRSLERSEVTVVSIFVNPAQFGPNSDLAQYPQDIARDEEILRREGVHYLFAPDAGTIYPAGYKTWVEVEKLTSFLDGPSRPGYFRGICTVVTKLFNIVRPDITFFGQKDYQQAVVIRQLIRDLHLEIEFEMLPTVREADGLAMSSRNTYLSSAERAKAPLLYQSLCVAQQLFARGVRDAALLAESAREILSREAALNVDYISIVDAENLQPVEIVRSAACLAVAAVLGGTRLIDNILLAP